MIGTIDCGMVKKIESAPLALGNVLVTLNAGLLEREKSHWGGPNLLWKNHGWKEVKELRKMLEVPTFPISAHCIDFGALCSFAAVLHLHWQWSLHLKKGSSFIAKFWLFLFRNLQH